ncbi:DUF2069 domain-containing protein [Endozoicomonas ascidiicola]|uniref:DUF2069 domain-containing protein n=1 Tax=Endozoicomonas ascidiicola TaxID=1698521 RepID=UPI0008325900|nr:DUF2069 domain-containing protein [Endozoicomonas ascidiicola]
MQEKANRIYHISLALYAGLVLSLLAETWWFTPPDNHVWIISLLQLLPLFLPLYGLLKRGIRAASWLCFILCFYFTSGVLDAWLRPEQPHGWFITGFSVSLFITSIMFIRWQAQANREMANA